MPASVQCGYTWKTIQEDMLRDTPPAPVISIRTQSVIPDSWANTLTAILTRSTGYDHVVKYSKRNAPIPSGYLPLYCSTAVAEQAMLFWMALLRKFPRQIEQFSTFHRDGLTGRECTGKNLLVVGVGNIGMEIVRLGTLLGMNVSGVDIEEKHESVAYVSFDEGAKNADIVVCSMNLTEENERYFDYKKLKKLKPGTIFINIARGELSPCADLLKLIEEQHLGGLALDVYNEEGLLAVSLRGHATAHSEDIESIKKLQHFPNVILTPHNAFNTTESVDRKAEQSVRQTTSFLRSGSFIWNVPGY